MSGGPGEGDEESAKCEILEIETAPPAAGVTAVQLRTLAAREATLVFVVRVARCTTQVFSSQKSKCINTFFLAYFKIDIREVWRSYTQLITSPPH